MIFNIPAGGAQKARVSVYGAASETVTLTHEKGKVFNTQTDSSGVGGTIEIPVGMYTITGSYSGYTKKMLVLKTTKEVYAMPNGDIVYWYGYSQYTPKAVSYVHSGETTNTKTPELSVSTRQFTVTQPSSSGEYCGSVMFDNVKTSGGIPTLISTGRNNSSSYVRCYFTIANAISKTQFEYIDTDRMDYHESPAKLESVGEGTYDLAISVRNYAAGGLAAKVTAYAIYFASPAGESDAPLDKTYLFNNGVINRHLTVGINGTINDGAINFSGTLAKSTNKTYTTKATVNLTGVNRIKARMKSDLAEESAYFRLVVVDSEKDGDGPGTSALEAYEQSPSPFNDEERVVTLDVSNITGKWYIGYAWGVLSSSSESKKINGDIYEWWIE